MNPLSAVYGGVARLRRSWYERRPGSRVLLPCPVISVGNLSVGGSGKTPIVAAIARLLRATGHRPAILSRGYGRRSTSSVVIVSDGNGPAVAVEESGDEPQMLARDLPDVPIVIAADRARAGQVAIEQFRPTVLILDDGYQHLHLQRTVDLLVVAGADLDEAVLPAGRLREPLSAARSAHAVLVSGSLQDAQRVAARVNVARAFGVTTHVLPLQPMLAASPPAAARAVAVAGIARPERFFDALRGQGHEIVAERAFRDHHWFSALDVQEIERQARDSGVDWIVTTAKDAVRLERHRDMMTLRWAILPISVTIEPEEEFKTWLQQRV